MDISKYNLMVPPFEFVPFEKKNKQTSHRGTVKSYAQNRFADSGCNEVSQQ